MKYLIHTTAGFKHQRFNLYVQTFSLRFDLRIQPPGPVTNTGLITDARLNPTR